MMPKILTLTPNPALDIATHVARLVPSEKMRCAAVRCDPGGGGINVARVVHRLGGDALAVYASGGSAGMEIQNLLDREGVPHRPVHIAGETRENFNVTDDSTGRQYRFILPGAALSRGEWNACTAAALSALAAGDYFVCSGSLPPGVPDDFYAGAISAARTKDAITVADTQGAALRAVLDGGVDIIKASASELGAYIGSTPDCIRAWRDALAQIVQAGKVKCAIVTLGEQGAVLVTRSEAWHASVPKQRASTSVGAGDSFLGALLVKLIGGCSSETALRHAAAAGTASLEATGTGLCAPADVDRLSAQVIVAKV